MDNPKLPADLLLTAYQTAFANSSQGFCLIEKTSTPPSVDFRYLLTNSAFDQQAGLTQVVGKTIRQLIPQVEAPVIDYYDAVARTGEAVQFDIYVAALDRWMAVDAFRVGELPAPRIGVLFTNITQRKQAELTLQASEMALRNAVELAQLGTFSVEVATNQLTISPRVAEWFGFEQLTADADVFIASVGEPYREQVRASLYNTLLPNSDGRYDVIHSVINAKTGRQTILHALGQLYMDASGTHMRIEGTAQDITAAQELQLVLTQQVQQRTQELAASNQGYIRLNSELEATNQLLAQSNHNLQTFAYIASHDLQEPLRKVQQFGDILHRQYAPVLGEGLLYLERMQSAARRMSALIKDLLEYASLGNQRAMNEPVALDRLIEQVLIDFELVIEETEAQVIVEPLPSVLGDVSQLNQLFQNLLSNAFKFSRQDHTGGVVVPRIQICWELVAGSALPAGVTPIRSSAYYARIDVIDNGIGFDEKYLDRIFEVFQQLNGKRAFGGTGIGLAICAKIVAQHGGAITARSQANQGATFNVYLPWLGKPPMPVQIL